VYEASATVLSGAISVDVTIDVDADLVTIVASSTEDGYFAVGFGSSTMSGTYAIVMNVMDGGSLVDGVERQLGNHAPGSKVSTSGFSISQEDGTYTITRPISASTFDFCDEECSAMTMNAIASYGASTTFVQHANRTPFTLTFTASSSGTATTTTTATTTDSADDQTTTDDGIDDDVAKMGAPSLVSLIAIVLSLYAILV